MQEDIAMFNVLSVERVKIFVLTKNRFGEREKLRRDRMWKIIPRETSSPEVNSEDAFKAKNIEGAFEHTQDYIVYT